MSRPWTQGEIFLGILVVAALVWAYINREAVAKWYNSLSNPVPDNKSDGSGSADGSGSGASGSGASGSKPAQPAPTPQPPKYVYQGCYKDMDARDLPIHGGNMTVEECANQARGLKYGVFGIQYSDGSGFSGRGGECWYGKDKGYGMYGVETNCSLMPNGNGLGQGFSNAIYAWDDMPH